MFDGKQDRQIDINCRTISKRIYPFPQIDKKLRVIPLKIFPSIFSRHEQLMLGNLGRRWPFSFKGQLEMGDDPIDNFMIFNESNDLHLTSTRRAETTSLTGKHEKTLFSTALTPDAGKPTHRIAAVEIALDHLLDYRTEISVLLFKTILIFYKKPLEIMKKHPVEDDALRMSKTIDPCHGRSHRSRNGSTSWIRLPPPEKAIRAPAQKGESGRENVNRC